MSKEKTIKVSFPFASAMTLVFIILKLTGTAPVSNWSWWWVVSPFWLPTAIILGIFLIFMFFAFFFGFIAKVFGD